MKKSSFLLLAFSFLLLFSCGKEDGELTIPDNFTKKVIAEKFTGEWCGACTTAGSFFKDNRLSRQFIGVGIHSGSQHDRYKDKQACKDMWRQINRDFLAPGQTSVSFPNIIFDRTGNDEGEVVNGLSSGTWKSHFDKLAAQLPVCGLSIKSEVTAGMLSGTISYVLKELQANPLSITVYLVENNLDGSEQVGGSAAYTHNAVLRELMTDKAGDSIGGSLTDQIVEFNFSSVDISEYKLADLEIIAFIHESGNEMSDKKILNGQKAAVGVTQDFD